MFLIVFCFALNGCAYQLEGSNPQIPSGARTIAIAPIQNQTLRAGIDTRLMRHLKKLLRNNSSVRLSTVPEAEVVIEIRLRSLRSKQTSISSDGSTIALNLDLEGAVNFVARGNSIKPLWQEKNLSANGSLLYEKGEANTGLTGSSIDRGLNEVTAAFAKRIYERIFFQF